MKNCSELIWINTNLKKIDKRSHLQQNRNAPDRFGNNDSTIKSVLLQNNDSSTMSVITVDNVFTSHSGEKVKEIITLH